MRKFQRKLKIKEREREREMPHPDGSEVPSAKRQKKGKLPTNA